MRAEGAEYTSRSMTRPSTRRRQAISRGTLINLIILAIAWFTGAARKADSLADPARGPRISNPTVGDLSAGVSCHRRGAGERSMDGDAALITQFARTIEHNAIAFVGGSFVLICQTLMPKYWLVPAIGMLLVALLLHRILFATRAGFFSAIWLGVGLVVADFLLPASSAGMRGTPVYLIWLSMIITIWSGLLAPDAVRLSWWLCGLDRRNAEHEFPRIDTNLHE